MNLSLVLVGAFAALLLAVVLVVFVCRRYLFLP